MRAWLRNLPGPQVHVWGRRIHHGRVGVWLVIVGAVLCLHDRRDYPWSFHDR